MRNIKISEDTFLKLIRYFCFEDTSETLYNALKSDLSIKLDKVIAHEAYSLYKTSDSVTEKEEARQRYLDLKGIHKDFRY